MIRKFLPLVMMATLGCLGSVDTGDESEGDGGEANGGQNPGGSGGGGSGGTGAGGTNPGGTNPGGTNPGGTNPGGSGGGGTGGGGTGPGGSGGSEPCDPPSYPSECAEVSGFQCGFFATCDGGVITAEWHEHWWCGGEEQIDEFACTHVCEYGCSDEDPGWPQSGAELVEVACASEPYSS